MSSAAMGVSLDGYIVGPDGGFGWPAPDEEVFRLVTDEIRGVGVHLLGRRLYETMLYWETADQDPSLDDSMLEWAATWKPLPKVVFSTTTAWRASLLVRRPLARLARRYGPRRGQGLVAWPRRGFIRRLAAVGAGRAAWSAAGPRDAAAGGGCRRRLCG